jgi:hypothetical protein
MRSRAIVSTLVLTSCLAGQTIVVAPRPVVRSDKAARAAFATSAMALLEQIARADSLEPVVPQDQLSEWTTCFQHREPGFRVCGRMEDSVMRIQFAQKGRFYGQGDAVRREVIESLRSAFGKNRVRECTFNWRGFEKCPLLAQLDSGA